GLISPDSLIAKLMGSNMSPEEKAESTCVICRRSFGHPKLLQTHLASHLTGIPLAGSASPRTSQDMIESAALRRNNNSNNNNLLSPGISPQIMSPLSPLSTTSSNNTESVGLNTKQRDSDDESLYHQSLLYKNQLNLSGRNKDSGGSYDSNGNQSLLLKVKPELYPCAFCPTVFSEMNGLAKHINLHHGHLTIDSAAAAATHSLQLQSALRLVQQSSGLTFPIPQHT
ncbi:unnamed protein product, partial [Allacma fusca]